MTLNEKKVIVEFLRNGDEVTKILMADMAENTYPTEIFEILDGVFGAIMKVDELDQYKLENDAKNIMKEIECNYTFDEKSNFDLLAVQLRMMADESEAFSNRLFEVGVDAVLNEFYKEYVSEIE